MLAVTCGLLVFWLAQLQSRIGQQEAICDTLLSKQRRFAAGEDDSDSKDSSRHARALDTTSTPGVGSLVEKMADLQVRNLSTRTSPDRHVSNTCGDARSIPDVKMK